MELYFSGRIVSLVDETITQEVDRIGPITGWDRRDSGKVVLFTTSYQGTRIEYHIEKGSFSEAYDRIIRKSNSIKPEPGNVDPKLSAVLGSFGQFPWKSEKPVECKPSKTPMKLIKFSRRSHSPPSASVKQIKISRSPDTEKHIKIKKTPSLPSLSLKKSHENGDQNDSFSRTMNEIPTILESFGKSAGFGSNLRKLLPANRKESADAVAAFLLFVLERQKIWVNKSRGVAPLTENLVLGTKWFTNMYRELDRGTIYFKRQMIKTTLKGVEINQKKISESLVKEILFKSILYRLLNKVETFLDFGEIPSISSLSRFLNYLKERKENNEIIFTAAHQNMGLVRLLKTLEFVKKNISSLTAEVVAGARKRSNRDCFRAILKIPNVGDFFAWQILTDLLECRVLGVNTDNQWTCLGPGAKNGLRRVFQLDSTQGELRLTRLLRDLCSPAGPGSGFSALGLKFPAFLDKALSLKNVEHALCEYDKYFRSAQGIQVKEREYSSQKSRVGLDTELRCEVCHQRAGGGGRVSCALCGSLCHNSCRSSWTCQLQPDGNLLCGDCTQYEQAWQQEDFSYEEYDESDEIARAHTSGGMKKASRNRRKAVKKKTKSEKIECIDLSSDEEDEDELELDDYDDFSDDFSDGDDEVQIVSHFFGVPNESEEEKEDEESDDPFANIEDWVADDEDDNLEGDDEIVIIE